jgi:hypothetical protein
LTQHKINVLQRKSRQSNSALFHHFNIDWTVRRRNVKSLERLDRASQAPLRSVFGIDSQRPVVVDPLAGSRKRPHPIRQRHTIARRAGTAAAIRSPAKPGPEPGKPDPAPAGSGSAASTSTRVGADSLRSTSEVIRTCTSGGACPGAVRHVHPDPDHQPRRRRLRDLHQISRTASSHPQRHRSATSIAHPRRELHGAIASQIAPPIATERVGQRSIGIPIALGLDHDRECECPRVRPPAVRSPPAPRLLMITDDQPRMRPRVTRRSDRVIVRRPQLVEKSRPSESSPPHVLPRKSQLTQHLPTESSNRPEIDHTRVRRATPADLHPDLSDHSPGHFTHRRTA